MNDATLHRGFDVLVTSCRLLDAGCFTAEAMRRETSATGWTIGEVSGTLDELVRGGYLVRVAIAISPAPAPDDPGPLTAGYMAGPAHPLRHYERKMDR